jgi:hypothetical protein
MSENERGINDKLVRESSEISRAYREWLETARLDLSNTTDPIERIVRVLVVADNARRYTYGRELDWAMVRMLLPDLGPSEDPEREVPSTKSLRSRPRAGAAWDHNAVHAWFTTNVKLPPTHPRIEVATRGVFGRRYRQVPGWKFNGGSTRANPKDRCCFNITILRDGRRLAEEDGFNAGALIQMAALTQLPKLPAAPPKLATEPGDLCLCVGAVPIHEQAGGPEPSTAPSKPSVNAAADDRFGQFDVVRLTIPRATEGSRAPSIPQRGVA